MMIKIKAVFENGAFRPLTPVSIPESTIVNLTISPLNSIVDALAEIARLPVMSPHDGFSGADHDRILQNNSTPFSLAPKV